MMIRSTVCIIFLVLLYSCNQENKDANKIDKAASLDTNRTIIKGEEAQSKMESSQEYDINEIIPEGYKILDSTKGDLNLDEYSDYILILKNIKEDSVMDPETKRLVLLVIGLPDHNVLVKEKSYNVVWPQGMGGGFLEAYTEVTLDEGTFVIEHQGGNHYRWSLMEFYSYTSSDSTWYLHKKITTETDVNNLEEGETVNEETVKDFGIIRFEDYRSFQE